MQSQTELGLALVLIAGMMSGTCMAPLKKIHRWKWENAWLVFSLSCLIVYPWALAAFTIPHLGTVYASASWSDLAPPFVFGFLWGVAQVLYGLTIVNLGLALGTAIVLGLGGTFGTLVPVAIQQPAVLATGRGALLLAGTAVMLLGIAVLGHAGRRRELATSAKQDARAPRQGYRGALLVAVVCGVLAPMINFGLAFGGDLANRAVALGAAPANATFAVWPVALAGGLIPNLAYALYLLQKNRTWGIFRSGLPDAAWSLSMGLLWLGGVASYGVASRYLGALGTSAGWALFQIVMIAAANVAGVVAGEWKAAGRGPVRTLLAGLMLLAAATALMAFANR